MRAMRMMVICLGLLAVGCDSDSNNNNNNGAGAGTNTGGTTGGTGTGGTTGGTDTGGTTGGATTDGGTTATPTDPTKALLESVCSAADMTALQSTEDSQACDAAYEESGAAYADCLNLTDACKACFGQLLDCLSAAFESEDDDPCHEPCSGSDSDPIDDDACLACDYAETETALAGCDVTACE